MASTSNQGHEGAAQPMMHLQGGTGPVYTQAPDDQSENYMNTRGQSENAMIDWASTVIGSGMKGGDTPNSGNDTRNAPV